jgi:hypothetical protein
VQPPNIAFPCGHVVCSEDFALIGGRIGDRTTVTEEDMEEPVEDEMEFRRGFVEHVLDSGVMPASSAGWLHQMLLTPDPVSREASRRAPARTNAAPPRRRNHSADDDDDSAASMPILEQDSEEDDDADSLPELVEGRVDTSSSEDDMPALMDRGGLVDSSSEDDSVPDLADRVAQMGFHDSSDDDEPMPVLVDRTPAADDDDSSDDDGLPGLASRHAYGENSSSDEDSVPDLLRQRGRDDSSEDTDSVPGLIDRSSGVRAVSSSTPGDGDIGAEGVFLYKSGWGFKWCSLSHHQLVHRISDASSPTTKYFPMNGGFIEQRGNSATANYVIGDVAAPSFTIPVFGNAQIVSDSGGEAMWTLSRDAGVAGCQILKFFHRSTYPQGKPIRRVSLQSTVVQGAEESAWVHVQQGTRHIPAGLWFFNVYGQKHVLKGNEISANAKIIPDGDRGLIWVLDYIQTSSIHALTLVGRNMAATTYRLPCDNSKDTRIFPNDMGGVFVHARKDGEWGLFTFFREAAGTMTPLKACPKDAKIAADGCGHVWVLQKESRNSSQRMLWRVDARGTVREIPTRYPAGVTMTGAY